MGKFSGTLLSSDFDRTLVDHSLVPSKEVSDAIAYYKANGGLFTINTGRSHRIFDPDPALLNAPAILGNGSMVIDWENRDILHLSGIGDEGLAPLRDVRDFFPNVAIEMHAIDDTTFSIRREEGFYTEVNDPADACRPWVKAIIEGEHIDIAGVQKFLAAYHRNSISFFPTTGGYLEVVRCGVNKASGMRWLAKHLGIDMAKVFAVGDGYNDVEMLEAAAIGFVPENSGPEAKSVADRIVRSVDDHAVAHVIEILDSMF